MDNRNNQRTFTSSESPATWLASGREPAVFVDDSGRRARCVRVASFALAVLCAFWLAGLTVGMTYFSGFPAGRTQIAGPTQIGGLRVPARSGIVRATIPRVEVREFASGSAARRARES